MSDIDLAAIVAEDAKQNPAPAPAVAAPAEKPEVEDTAEATAAPADEAAKEQDGDEGAAEEVKPKKPGGGFQKRISELTREKHEALRRAEHAEKLAEKALSVAAPARTPATASDDEPRPEQFTKYEDYVAAKAEYRADKRFEAHLSKLDESLKGRTAQQTQAAKVEAFVVEAKRQGKEIEGFEDALETVRSDGFPMNQTIGDYLLDAAENKAGLVKYLADNEDEAFKISRLGTVAAVKALAQVEARISAKPKPKTSSAPPPPARVSGGAAAQQSIERMPHKDLKELVQTWGRN